MRARSWRTALTFRSSPTASCTLWSSQRRLRKIPDATLASHLISMALTPRQLRSMSKVILVLLSFLLTLELNTVSDAACALVCSNRQAPPLRILRGNSTLNMSPSEFLPCCHFKKLFLWTFIYFIATLNETVPVFLL